MAKAAEDSAHYAFSQTVIAGAAAVLLLFTLAANAVATWLMRRTVSVATDTARRQLRAYVHVTDRRLKAFEIGQRPSPRLEIRNSGQTHAHRVVVYGHAKIVDFPLDGDPAIDRSSNTARSSETLGPGGRRYKDDLEIEPLTQEDWLAIIENRRAVLAWGEIDYWDVWGNQWKTGYRYFLRGDIYDRRGLEMAAHERGNDAT